ncbi:MAG: hypothetical protein ACLPYY_14920 [Acidimicrobiales bacterium]
MDSAERRAGRPPLTVTHEGRRDDVVSGHGGTEGRSSVVDDPA